MIQIIPRMIHQRPHKLIARIQLYRIPIHINRPLDLSHPVRLKILRRTAIRNRHRHRIRFRIVAHRNLIFQVRPLIVAVVGILRMKAEWRQITHLMRGRLSESNRLRPILRDIQSKSAVDHPIGLAGRVAHDAQVMQFRRPTHHGFH